MVGLCNDSDHPSRRVLLRSSANLTGSHSSRWAVN